MSVSLRKRGDVVRYDVRLYSPRGKAYDVHTFTWEANYRFAVNRVARGMDVTDADGNDLWEGWSFAVVPRADDKIVGV